MKKLSMKTIKEKISADSYSRKDDVITVRIGFFYTMGRTTENLINSVLKSFPGAKIIDSGIKWKSFRGGDTISQGSHWFVKFII